MNRFFYSIKQITFFFLLILIFTSCKKHIPDIPENILCNGNGQNNYLPLNIGNKWQYFEYGLANSSEEIISDTILNEKKYYKVKNSQGNNYQFCYLRMNSNGDIYSYYSDSLEFLFIPANPAVGQVVCIYPTGNIIASRVVLAVNETREVSGCVYFGTLKIQDYDFNGTANTTYYYKKGLGLVESENWGLKQLIDVTLN